MDFSASDTSPTVGRGILSTRIIPPAHYTLTIKSFSSLSTILRLHRKKKIESDVFRAGGYQWRLSLYPEGDKKNNGDGYVSLYLVLSEELNKISPGFEIHAVIKFFVYDHFEQNYLTIQDNEGMVRRFHNKTRKQGFSQLILQSILRNELKGYLVRDSCQFGVEIFVIERRTRVEFVAVLREGEENCHFTWKIADFSKLSKHNYLSEEFSFGGRNWKLKIYPRGNQASYLSLYLILSDCSGNALINTMQWLRNQLMLNNKSGNALINTMQWLRNQLMLNNKKKESPSWDASFVDCMLQVVDQKNGNHKQVNLYSEFSKYSKIGGFSKFMVLSDLHDQSRGYLVDDTLIVQVKFGNIFADRHLCQ